MVSVDILLVREMAWIECERVRGKGLASNNYSIQAGWLGRGRLSVGSKVKIGLNKK